jgi:hypothetical protein
MSANANIQLKIENLSQFAQEGLDSRRLSDAVYLHGLPWKILAIPRELRQHQLNNELPLLQRKCLSFFLKCNANNAGILICFNSVLEFFFLDPAWSCNGSARFKVLAQKVGKEDHAREIIPHVFSAKENDWGWAQFKTFHVCGFSPN